jgi:lipid-binding SYLF domain-containing protein
MAISLLFIKLSVVYLSSNWRKAHASGRRPGHASGRCPWQSYCMDTFVHAISVTYNLLCMKTKNTVRLVALLMTVASLFLPRLSMAQDESQERIINDSKDARSTFRTADPSMENLFKNSAGYVIFPNVGKGAIGVGGAGGRGTVYEKGIPIGTAQMVQVTVGAQAGGQAYREIIFFKDKEELDRFMDNKFEFSEQASAVAVKAGVSANTDYRHGVAVFSQEKGGLMLEASLGGQKFTYKALK